MTTFRRKGDCRRYDFSDPSCIEAHCWAPGLYQHRGATGSGSVATSSPASPCCLNRAHRGCPQPGALGYDGKLAKLRRKEGWDVA